MNPPTRDNPMFSDDEIIELARSVQEHDHERIAPPPLVWSNIQAELEAEQAPTSITRRQEQRWFSSTRLLSIAAATLLMVGVVAAVVTTRDNDTVTELAAAMLTDEGLPVSTSETANATFVCEDDSCFVEVDLTALPDAGADQLELWVINGDVTDMYSLGNITESDGRYPLPQGVTAEDYPIVDISIEPDDGDETHSGQSVLRGTLTDT